jgi:putative transposase
VPRHQFDALAREHHVGAPLRRMSRWAQLVALLAAQLTGRQSLRDIEGLLKTQQARLYHLGGQPVPRSSLARLNAEQPCTLFEALFQRLVTATQKASPKHRFRFKNRLLAFDGSLIELSLALFPWAHFANRKAALKLHVGLDHGGGLPVFATLAAPHASEAEFVRRQALPKGSIAVFDRGCVSFDLLAELGRRGIFFVTRLKDHNRVRVVESREVRRGVVADETIEIAGQAARAARLPQLRRVTDVDPLSAQRYAFLTHNFRLAARTIADLYQERWQIELFFKWLKQNLRIKSFLGTTLNAVLTQIWIALCTYLLLAYLKFINRLDLSLQQLLRLLQVNLFHRRDLLTLLRGEARDPPPKWQQNQLVLV